MITFEKPEITFCLFPELACEEGVNPVFVQTAVNPASYGLQLKQYSDSVILYEVKRDIAHNINAFINNYNSQEPLINIYSIITNIQKEL